MNLNRKMKFADLISVAETVDGSDGIADNEIQ